MMSKLHVILCHNMRLKIGLDLALSNLEKLALLSSISEKGMCHPLISGIVECWSHCHHNMRGRSTSSVEIGKPSLDINCLANLYEALECCALGSIVKAAGRHFLSILV